MLAAIATAGNWLGSIGRWLYGRRREKQLVEAQRIQAAHDLDAWVEERTSRLESARDQNNSQLAARGIYSSGSHDQFRQETHTAALSEFRRMYDDAVRKIEPTNITRREGTWWRASPLELPLAESTVALLDAWHRSMTSTS